MTPRAAPLTVEEVTAAIREGLEHAGLTSAIALQVHLAIGPHVWMLLCKALDAARAAASGDWYRSAPNICIPCQARFVDGAALVRHEEDVHGAPAAASGDGLAAALDSDDFRDRHERVIRDHILGGPEDHVCDDLCSASIIDRLVGKTPTNEYPLQPQYAATPEVAAGVGLDMERLRKAIRNTVYRVEVRTDSNRGTLPAEGPIQREWNETTVEAIAAEYARLAPQRDVIAGSEG